jgi:hypothetical protein
VIIIFIDIAVRDQKFVGHWSSGIMLAIGPPRFVASNPAEDDGFLMAIILHNTTSFRGQVKLSVPHHKILWHVKDPYSMKDL